jgi:hypothetical protein
MSEAQRFCPGDWRVEERTREQQAAFLPAYQIVAYLPDEPEEGGLWLADVGINPDDDKADAQVMAASKALYLALAAVLHSIDAHSRLVMLGEVYGLVNEAAIEAARAALALVERRV